VYPILGFVVAPPAAGGVIDYQGDGRPQPNGFWEYKVLWAVSRSYTGAFTVQAKQIDGPNQVKWIIENSQVVPKLDLPGGFGWHYYATSALLTGAGCYALRVEGSSFSRFIIFKAVATRTFRELTRRRPA
jgi:hypothetical protein